MSKRIFVLYTGGTIGMERSPQGYVPAGLERLIEAMVPPLWAADMPAYTVLEYPNPLDSANLRPHDWLRIARDLVDNYPLYDGFVVLHGTDTMAYTAAALSFMLQGLGKPVILTGSQIPLRELRNDAHNNLLTALLLAARHPVPEVCLYFNGRLLRGNRASKLKADGFDAFISPNYPPLADIGIHIEIHQDRLHAWPGPEDFRLPAAYRDGEVAVLRLFPGISADWLERLLAPPLAGLVLGSYGVGNGPDQDAALLAVLRAATTRGVVIVNVTQCAYGRVDPAGYAAGLALAGAGLSSGLDLTTEAAFVKLHHLLAQGLEPDQVRAALARNLCGECTPD